MKFNNLLCFLLVATLLLTCVSALDIGVSGEIGLDLNINPLDINDGGNYSINVNHSSSSDNAILFDGYSVSGLYSYYRGLLHTYFDGFYAPITEPLSLHLNQDNWFNDSSNYTYWDGDSLETDIDKFDERYLTGQLSMYFYNSTSAFNSSYTEMNSTIPSGDAQLNHYHSLTNGDNLLTKRIFTEINLTLLQSGAYNQHTTIDYHSGTKDTSMKSELYILRANGTEQMIGQSPPSIGLIVGAYQQVIWSGVINDDVIFSEGDYLTMYLYATVSGVGQAPDIDLIVADDTAARLDIGINPTDIAITEVDPIYESEKTNYFRVDGTSSMQGNANMDGNDITNVGSISGNGSFRTDADIVIGNAESPEAGLTISKDDSSAGIDIKRYSTDTYPPYLSLYKSRGTFASPSQVKAGDTVGLFDIYANTGNGFVLMGTPIEVVATEDVSATNRGNKLNMYVIQNGTTSPILASSILDSGITHSYYGITSDGNIDASGSNISADAITSYGRTVVTYELNQTGTNSSLKWIRN